MNKSPIMLYEAKRNKNIFLFPFSFVGPSNCGNPDRHENSTVLERDFRLGQSVTYSCPEGNRVVGDRVRKCESNGFWSGTAPTCQCKYRLI